MLYNVITFTGKAVIDVSLYDAKRFLRAYYDIYSRKPDFRAKMRGYKVWVSKYGGEPYVICQIKRSHPVKI